MEKTVEATKLVRLYRSGCWVRNGGAREMIGIDGRKYVGTSVGIHSLPAALRAGASSLVRLALS